MGMEEMKRELDDLNAKISPLESKELDSLRLEIVKMRKEIINATLEKDQALQTLENLKKELAQERLWALGNTTALQNMSQTVAALKEDETDREKEVPAREYQKQLRIEDGMFSRLGKKLTCCLC